MSTAPITSAPSMPPAAEPVLPSPGAAPAMPTIWGLSPTDLHDHFWAARGVQVVRRGEPSNIVDRAELFLLTDARTLVIFRLRDLVDLLSWLKPDLVFIRLKGTQTRDYQEVVQTGPDGRFLGYRRIYGNFDIHMARVALTPDPDLAKQWQSAESTAKIWHRFRRQFPRSCRTTQRVSGSIYDRAQPAQTAQFVRDLAAYWRNPASTIGRACKTGSAGWVDSDVKLDPQVKLVGPVWVGAGRHIADATPIVGPAVLWDDPAARPALEGIQWQELEPTDPFHRPAQPRRLSGLARAFKRTFDIAFALVAILMTLPVYPIVMLAIWLEDGRPFFFAHKRETLGGREFGCLKFRSMRKDADQIKARLKAQNQADGPQFFMEDDPRLTRVGRLIRKANIDELPQFFNVLFGDMAIVGPRPSPRSENQYCPPWREARLSVRPGITGLWQVKRTRRQGMDFQEWIKFDIQYVENLSFWLDMSIIWQTIVYLIRGVIRI